MVLLGNKIYQKIGASGAMLYTFVRKVMQFIIFVTLRGWIRLP